MIKKFFVFLFALSMLTACGRPAKPAVDFGSPTGGPDLIKMNPSYGPNDPVPVPVSDEGSNR